jgi:hypothetical protein
MPLRGTPVKTLITNSSMLTASTTPRYTRSMPSRLAVGNRITNNNSSMMDVSRKQLSTKKPSGDNFMLVSQLATSTGTFSAVKAHLLDAGALRVQHGYVDILPFRQAWGYSASGTRRSVEDSLSPQTQAAVMGGNARQLYSL